METIIDVLVWILQFVFLFFTGWIVILGCLVFGPTAGCQAVVPTMLLILAMGLAVVFIPIGLWFWRPIVQRLHYIFSPHPGVEVVKKASGGKPLDSEALASTMDAGRNASVPPGFVSENRARQARAATERLRAEKDLMDAAIERERSRERRADKRRHET